MQVKSTFDRIQSAFVVYQATIASIMSRYRRDVAEAAQHASQYKDEATKLAARKDTLIAAARREVAEADQQLHNAIMEQLPVLRHALADVVCAPADRELMWALRDVSDFHIKLTEAEIRAYVTKAAGNHAALRALAAISERSGYRLTIPDVTRLEADVARLERVAARFPMMFAPVDYVHEALEVLEDMPVFRADGSVAYRSGRPDTVYLLMQAQQMQETLDALDNAAERWTADYVPQLSELEPVVTADGEEISPEDQQALARQVAARRVDVADANVQEDLVVTAKEWAEADRAANEAFRKYYL